MSGSSTSVPGSPEVGLHVAIIMDGNGRWASARSRPRIEGHRAGARALRRTVEAAPGLGIRTLTLYAFSSDNWKRPASEVGALMEMFEHYLRNETEDCIQNGVRLSVIGRRDRLASSLRQEIARTEQATRDLDTLHVRLAVDYSARDQILFAASRVRTSEMVVSGGSLTRAQFAMLLGGEGGEPVPDVDLLIRTGGEQRLSDFLLWECAYAELYFTSRMWPEFDETELRHAVAYFHNRERRFGAIPQQVAV
jgi:undecaprenyl diphosphate synthase